MPGVTRNSVIASMGTFCLLLIKEYIQYYWVYKYRYNRTMAKGMFTWKYKYFS